MKDQIQTRAEVLQTYADYERQITIKHLQIGCYLVMLLMPAGAILDHYVYPDKAGHFFELRLWCSLLAGGVWAGDPARALRVARRMHTGVVSINGNSAPFPLVPFGGFKESGMGREIGRASCRERVYVLV